MNIDIDKLENHESILALLDEMGRDLELSEGSCVGLLIHYEFQNYRIL